MATQIQQAPRPRRLLRQAAGRLSPDRRTRRSRCSIRRSCSAPSVDAFRKLDPRLVAKNPVMFVVEVGSVITTYYFFKELLTHARGHAGSSGRSRSGSGSPCCSPTSPRRWRRGAARRRPTRCARPRPRAWRARLVERQRKRAWPAPQLRKGDLVVCEAGEVIPGDGEVIEGIASVDESAITGESAPVIRESGGDRSAVTGGTKVLSDRIVIRITSNPGETFIDRMIALVEGAQRQKTPNEIALSILLAGLTIVFLLAVVTLLPYAIYSVRSAGAGTPPTITVLISLLVCLIPTTIGGLLSAIGIAGMDRVMQHNVLAMSGKAVEAAGDVNTLLLDKTGTITLGNRQAVEFIPAARRRDRRTGERRAALLAGRRDAGRPQHRGAGEGEVRPARARAGAISDAEFIPFTAQTRMSGVNMDGTQVRKGAAASVKSWVTEQGGSVPRRTRRDRHAHLLAGRHAAGRGA